MIVKHQHFDLLNKVVLERVVFKPPIKLNAAMHHEACYLFAVKGKSKLFSVTESVNLDTGQGVLMKCGNYLNSWHESELEDEEYEAIGIHLYPEIINHVYKNDIPEFLKNAQNLNQKSITQIKTDQLVEKFIENLQFYFENPELVDEEITILKVKELILILDKTDTTGDVRNVLRDLFNPVEYEFKEVINRHVYDNITIDELATLCNLSVSSFKRKFSELYNESPAKYLKLKKLQKASDLLKTTNKRVTDICFDSGFNDITHFSKSFTAYYGVSPTEFRDLS